jgi:hypothetical protein
MSSRLRSGGESKITKVLTIMKKKVCVGARPCEDGRMEHLFLRIRFPCFTCLFTQHSTFVQTPVLEKSARETKSKLNSTFSIFA